MSYRKIDLPTFGKHLLDTGDLDPVYIALRAMWPQPDEQTARWLLAYWCLYHAGLASWLSEKEGPEFWDSLHEAAENEPGTSPVDDRWPRGTERRHFRGDKAILSVKRLRQRYKTPEHAVYYMVNRLQPATLGTIIMRVAEHHLFGPWIGFKVADMAAQVLNAKIDFDETTIFLFEDPARGAERCYEDAFAGSIPPYTRKEAIEFSIGRCRAIFGKLKAPPRYDRNVDLPEIETILCKWKSHMNGHYPLGKDTRELLHGVRPWAEICPTAERFLDGLPTGEMRS